MITQKMCSKSIEIHPVVKDMNKEKKVNFFKI